VRIRGLVYSEKTSIRIKPMGEMKNRRRMDWVITEPKVLHLYRDVTSSETRMLGAKKDKKAETREKPRPTKETK